MESNKTATSLNDLCERLKQIEDELIACYSDKLVTERNLLIIRIRREREKEILESRKERHQDDASNYYLRFKFHL